MRRQSRQLLLVVVLAKFACVAALTVEAHESKAPPSPAQQSINEGIRHTDQTAQVAAFIADKEGKQAHDFFAWNRFRQITGDSPAARDLFREMAAAEPGLCASIGGEGKLLAEKINKRLDAIDFAMTHRTRVFNEDGANVDLSITLPQMLAIVLALSDANAKSSAHRDWDVGQILGPSPFVGRNQVPRARQHVKQWEQPDARRNAAKKLLTHWAAREVDPKLDAAWASIGGRLRVTKYYNLEEAKTPLAFEILRSPVRVGREATEFACMHVMKLGDKENRLLLERILDDKATEVFIVEKDRGDNPTQARDLALAAIVQLSGEKPEDYGLTKMQAEATVFREAMPIYLFSSPADRRRGFERCAKNYKQLGLKWPPRLSHEFTFTRYAGSSLPNVGTAPDGKVRLDVRKDTARLIEITTGKQIGRELAAQKAGESPRFTFSCWAFSADSAYVVTGSSYKAKRRAIDEVDESIGRVEVWDAATGELVEHYHGAAGSVLGVKFNDESTTVSFIAEQHSIEGP